MSQKQNHSLSLKSFWQKNRFSIILAAVLILVIVAFFFFSPNQNQPAVLFSPSIPTQNIQDHDLIQIEVSRQDGANSHQLTVEAVNTEASITQGLSDRSEIGADGMLFFMPRRDRHGFWMVRMKFPIDIVWLDQGCVVQISSNLPAPAPDQQPSDLPVYFSDQPTDQVLELPAGQAAAINLQVGDILTIK